MTSRLGAVFDEVMRLSRAQVRETVQRPRRFLSLAKPEKLRVLSRGVYQRLNLRARAAPLAPNWRTERGGVYRREYPDYNAYIAHQQAKLHTPGFDSWLADYDSQYRKALYTRLREDDAIGAGASVLCLGARIGTEVKAFHDLGCFAIGVDLDPGEANEYVVYGDFHGTKFPEGCLDIVFSNSLDHAHDLGDARDEIARLTKDDGLLILEAMKGQAEGCTPEEFEAMHWEHIDSLLAHFSGFSVLGRKEFEYPWEGEHVLMKRSRRGY